MQHALIFATCLIAASVGAQASKTVTSPVGYEDRDGLAHSYHLGRHASQRLQYGDGGLAGKSYVIQQIDYRLDRGRQYTTSTGMGRTFTRCSVMMGETDITKMTSTFSTNVIGAATKVFESKIALPTVSGTPLSAPWGAGGALSFPFSSAWTYSGKNDLLFDFTLEGGTLANGLTSWTGTSAISYYLDGAISVAPTSSYPVRGYDIPYPFTNGATTCNDSAITTTTGAYTRLTMTLYGDSYSTTSLAGTFAGQIQSRYTAPSAPLIRVVTFGGSETGFAVGAQCHNLYVDMTKVVVIESLTSASGSSLTTSSYSAKYEDIFSVATLWGQSAWTDSKTNAFALTTVFEMPLPTKPKLLPKIQTVANSATAAVATEAPADSYWKQSLPRLTVK